MSRRSLLCISGSVLIFIAALVIYRVQFDPGDTLLRTGFETTAIATSLATHGTFSDPFRVPTGPSAFLAPAFPTFIAVLMKLFGTGAAGIFALKWCVTVFIAAQLALWPWITRRMRMGYASGAIAAIIWLCAGMPRTDVWESHCVGLLTVLLAFTMFLVADAPTSRSMIVLCGLFWGIVLLFSPVALFVLPGFAVWLYFYRKLPIRRVALLLALAAAVIMPWIIRDYVVFHRVMYVRDNLGLELDLGNNDCATFSFDINLESGCFSQLHPNDNPNHAALVQNLGEIEYFHRHMILAKWWIANHPAAFLRLTAQRKLAFWLPSAMHYSWRPPRRDWFITAMNLICLYGLCLLWQRSKTTATVFLLWILLFPVIYYFVPYAERYRAPMLWATFLPAGFAIASLLRVPLSESNC